MIRVLFVGDGPRDAVCLPPIARTVLGRDVDPRFRAWREIRVGGNTRKVLFAIRVARDEKLDGVVAVVDSDREEPRQRLARLRAGRDQDRLGAPGIPTSVGEARPHFEAWLLDDNVAVTHALELPAGTAIPTVRQVPDDPKRTLGRLIAQAAELAEPDARSLSASFLPYLERIATQLDVRRCAHGKETGFSEFIEDLREEFRTLATRHRA